MKKLLALVGLGLIAILLVVSLLNRSSRSGIEIEHIADLESIPSGHEAEYSVKIVASQSQGQNASPLIELEGILAQSQRGANEFVSQWREISQLRMMGAASEPAQIKDMLNKPVITTIQGREVTHYIDDSFPQSLMTFHLGFLEKFYLGISPETGKSIVRSEKDEIGTAEVEYAFTQDGRNFRAIKTWLRYIQDFVRVDAEENNLVYAVGPDGRLLSLAGTITLHYRQPAFTHFKTYIRVTLKGHKAVAGSDRPITKETLKKTSILQAVAEVQQSQEHSQMSYDEALRSIDSVTVTTDGKEVYEAFSALKSAVILNPERASHLAAKILAERSRDASANRRLSAMFGALAQSQSAEGASSLAELATKCPDNFCKLQAIIGLNDHQNPTEDSASKMMQIAQSTSDSEISGTALLTAGSIGRKLSSELPTLPNELLAELANPAREEMKSTVIAAMGNHGDPEYYPALSANLAAEDSNLRSAAVYSMRYLPNEEVDGDLLAVLMKETDNDVTREVFKALQHRNLSEAQYMTVAEKTLTMEDMGMQHDAVRMLIDAYQVNPKAATASLNALRDKTQHPEIRTYIQAELDGQVVDSAP